jgi:hypothetical protein
MRSCNFLRLIYNKVTSRSYGYFLKFSYFYFLRNWFFQLCQKLQSLVKEAQGILGVRASSTQSLHPLPAKGGCGEQSRTLHRCRACEKERAPTRSLHGKLSKHWKSHPFPSPVPPLSGPTPLYSHRCYPWQGLHSTVGNGVSSKGLESKGRRSSQPKPSKLKKRWVPWQLEHVGTVGACRERFHPVPLGKSNFREPMQSTLRMLLIHIKQMLYDKTLYSYLFCIL